MTSNSKKRRATTPISRQCRRSLQKLSETRRNFRWSISPASSDALDDAMDKLQIAIDVCESEVS